MLIILEILGLSSPGLSSIVVFKNKAPTLLKLVPSDDDSDLDMSIKNVVKNIVSGRVAPAIVNVDNAVDIGTEQMELTEKNMAVGFYGPISKKVITMDITWKHVKLGAAKMFNTTLLFSRVIGLQASYQEKQ